jgi:hypothetical protein
MRKLVVALLAWAGLVGGCVSDDFSGANSRAMAPGPVHLYQSRLQDHRAAARRDDAARAARARRAAQSRERHAKARRTYRPSPVPARPIPLTTRPTRETWYPRGMRISPRWTSIVIHHSATDQGAASVFDKYHREKNGWDELGYHFVIGNGSYTPDGHIEVGARWHKQKHGAHCKTPDNYYNNHGIGICLVGNFEKTSPTARQMAALVRLTRFLAEECHIPAYRVTTHRCVNSKTRCPGRYFSLATVQRALAQPATASSMP